MPSSAPLAAPPGGLQAAVIGFAIRFRGVIVALALVLLGYGTLSVMRAKYDVFPEFAPPQVGIQTEAPGLTAEQVEILVTQPIENAINGVPAVQSLRSSSIQGLSVITIIFRSRERHLSRPPGGGRAPRRGRAPASLQRRRADHDAADLLLSRPCWCSASPPRSARSWTCARLPTGRCGCGCSRCRASPRLPCSAATCARSRCRSTPTSWCATTSLSMTCWQPRKKATAVTGAGFIETNNQRIVFQSEGQSIDPEDVARTVVASSGGSSVLLKDVADVVNAPEPAIGGAAVSGQARRGAARVGPARRQYDRRQRPHRGGARRPEARRSRRKAWSCAPTCSDRPISSASRRATCRSRCCSAACWSWSC